MLVLGDPTEVGWEKLKSDNSFGVTACGIQGKKVFPVTQRRGLVSNRNTRQNDVCTVFTKKAAKFSNSEETTSDSSSSSSSSDGGDASSDSSSTCEGVDGPSSDHLVVLQDYQPTIHDLAAEAGSKSVGSHEASASGNQSKLKGREGTSSSSTERMSKPVNAEASTSASAYASANGENVPLEDDDLPIFEEVMIDDSSETQNGTNNPSLSLQKEQTQKSDTQLSADENRQSWQKLISRTVRKAVRRAAPSQQPQQKQQQQQQQQQQQRVRSKQKASKQATSGVKTSSKKRSRVVEYSDSEESDIQDPDSSNSENGSEEKEVAEASEPDSELSDDRGTRSSISNRKKKNSAPSKKAKTAPKQTRKNNSAKNDNKTSSSSSPLKITKKHVNKKYLTNSTNTTSTSTSKKSASETLLESLAEFAKIQAKLGRELAALKRAAINAKQ
jgi:hypothetical protein